MHGRPRHPQSQGQVERANQTIKRMLGKPIFDEKSEKWVDKLSSIIYKYNTTVHRATNKSPFFLFHRRIGYNTVKVFIQDTHNNNKSLKNDLLQNSRNDNIKVNDSIDNEICKEKQAAQDLDTLEIGLSSSLSSLELDSTYFCDTINFLDEDSFTTRLDKSVDRHNNTYTKRWVNNANKNFQKIELQVGDTVLLKSDFDNNTKTRKNAFDGFYEYDHFVISEINSLHNVTIKNKRTNDVVVVSKSVLKKVE